MVGQLDGPVMVSIVVALVHVFLYVDSVRVFLNDNLSTYIKSNDNIALLKINYLRHGLFQASRDR